MDERLRKVLQMYANQYDWRLQAREAQKVPKKPWRHWLILAGRGFGKTRTGAETVRHFVEKNQARQIALIGQSLKEAQAIMVDGKSGILSISPYAKPVFESTKQVLTWKNGAKARLFSGDDFESLRGPQFDLVWIDEFAKFKSPKELWEQVQLTLRLGQNPRCIITTTPKPLTILQEIMEDVNTVVTRGTTFDNAQNLAPSFLTYMKEQFAFSRLGNQELYGEMQLEQDGALWNREMITYKPTPLDAFVRIVIAIDPATTYHEKSDETGIVVAGKLLDGTYVVVDDLSGRLSPANWGQRVVDAFHTYRADRVIAEVNKGGDLVERIITCIDGSIPFFAVRATRGKITRAEPIAALYEKKLVFHQRPLRDLEHQLCHYVSGATASPDRLDAMVWALTELSGMTSHFNIWSL